MNFFKFFKKSIKIHQMPFGKYQIYYSKGTSIIERYKRDGAYEKDFVLHLLRTLNKIEGEKVFIDVGANIGMISLLCLSELDNLTIYAFEPGKHQFDLFTKTIQENKLTSKIKLNSLALSNTKAIVDFHVHDPEDVSGDGFIDTKRAGKTSLTKVQTDTLDNWFDENKPSRIDVIKIDTEGAEFYILQGSQKIIQKFKPVIYLEINDKNIRNYPFEITDLLNYINCMNYQIFTLKSEVVNSENILPFIRENDTFILTPNN